MSGTRHAALDGVRVIALLAGVLFHATLSYADVPLAVAAWPGHDGNPSRLVSALLWWTRTFHLPLFFLLAGFAAEHSCATRGRDRFLRDRVQRLVVPFFVVGIGLLPLCYYVFSAGWWLAGECTWDQIRRVKFAPGLQRQIYGPAHLWFLPELFVCCLVVWARPMRTDEWRAALPHCLALRSNALHRCLVATRLKKIQASAIAAQNPAEPWRGGALRLLWWALPSAGVLLVDHGFVTGHLNSFVPNGLRLLYYGCFFAAGALLYRSRALLDEGRLSVRWLAASLPCFFITEHLLRQELSEGLTPGLRVVFVAGWSISAWLATLGCVGVSLRFLSHPSAQLRRLADASYWIYLAHVPLVVALQIVLIAVPLPPVPKVVLIVVGATAVCLWTYERWVRRSIVGSILNGGRTAAPGQRTLVAARVSIPGAG